MAACLLIMVCPLVLPRAASARQGVTAGASAIFYGDNTEFRNPFREGETIFGAAARLDAQVEITPAVTLSLGAFGNQRFGSDDAFDLVRPILAVTITGSRSSFVFGTLPAPRPGTPAGPDRTGPHGLLPPLQRETLAFERPYEAGLQWTFAGRAFRHEAWLEWQRLNTAAHRERLDAGLHAVLRPGGRVRVPVQLHIVHEGGQLFASGPVRDSLAGGSGIVLSTRPPMPVVGAAPPDARHRQPAGALELMALFSRHTPDREAANPTRTGRAFFGRASAGAHGWRAHIIAWRGDGFIKDEGDANYLSIRRDGTVYGGLRDYAEAGVTRTFELAPSARLEASARLHRVERHYEYSYRIVSVLDVRGRLR
jgi:hypothetical protein